VDTQKLIQNLRELSPKEYTWKLALYSAKKSRDGVELEWGACAMADIAGWADALREQLLEKGVADRTVEPYTPFLPVESIGALERSDELIREPMHDALLSIKNAHVYSPEDLASGLFPAPTGYAFYGEKLDVKGEVEAQTLFIRRANPLVSPKKARLCVTHGDTVAVSEKPIFKFPQTVDFLLLDGICYFVTQALEKDFGLVNRHAAICERRLAALAEASVLSDYERFELVALSPKNARKFADFDPEVLETVARLSIEERADFLGNHGVSIDSEGRMDSGDPEQCELIVDLLCSRSCHDALGRLSTGRAITPR